MATDEEIDQVIGARLQRARDQRRWSRPQLVALLPRPMPVNTYACYEQGIRPIPNSRLIEVCDVLGVAPGDILNNINPPRRRVYVKVHDGYAASRTSVHGSTTVYVDFTQDGQLVGVEFLGAIEVTDNGVEAQERDC